MRKLHSFFIAGLFLTGSLFLPSCVDVLEFRPNDGTKLLVVDGKLSTSDGVQTIRLSETAVTGRSDNFPPVSGAVITLRDDAGNVVPYTETQPGVYQLSGSAIKGTPGRTYVVRIEFSGKVYESNPETMPQTIRADSSFFTITNQKYVNAYASVPIPADVAYGPFLKWRIDNVYQFGEIFCHPLEPTLVCYVTQHYSNQLLPLLDGSLLTRGETARPFIAQKEADRTFGTLTYFNMYMETLTPDAFKYWEKVSLLLTQSGSFFDAPPGAIRGNITNVNNPEELVLGYFYTAPEDTTRFRVYPSDFLPYQLNPYCGVPGLPPSPLPGECCTCTLLPNSTLIKPDYWD